MREISQTYEVYFEYEIAKNNFKTFKPFREAACYGEIFNNSSFNFITYIKLNNFLAVETHMYAKQYIIRLCRIFDFKYKFNKDCTEVTISNFKNKFYVKSFLTLFRILFEGRYCGDDVSKNVNFIKWFVENEYKIKDLLKRLIHCHNEANLYLGSGHCIKRLRRKIKLLTKKDLLKYTPDESSSVQKFFYNPVN